MAHSPETMARLSVPNAKREAVCPEHGKYSSRQLSIKAWSRCPACVAEQAAAEAAAERKAQVEAAERRHRATLADARIPARFIGRTFESFVASEDAQRSALCVTRDFAEQFEDNLGRGAGLILSGMPGTGKSHLAAALLQHVMPRHPDVRYMTCLDLIRAVRDTWRRESERSETQVLAYLERLDLLVIDEVGVQYGTDGEQTVLFEVIDRRYREQRPLVLLTNQGREGLKKFCGDRSYDRLVETCRWVAFDWPSYRPTARREAR
jgi:DNA replication protein DnaC